MSIPLPPVPEQKRIVAKIEKLACAIQLENKNAGHLNVLLAATLDKAFKGEL